MRTAALSHRSAATIVKAHVVRAGFDAPAFSGHSLRAEFLSFAVGTGAGVLKSAEVSRHRSLETLCGYVRSVELFNAHAGIGTL